MAKAEVIEKVKAVKDAPSCYEGLKKVCEEYLASVGTDGEKAASDKLKAALKECVNSIDDMLGFVVTEDAKKYLGEEAARDLEIAGKEAKAKGEKYCLCAACAPGGWLLDHEDEF
ncbi:heat-shock protein Hsp90 [Dialister sp.]|uniref:heat-shock protein Hsp90 n=1 Tax=Dialister sp. TaxID=1955814 RepID=UPI002E803571|nr:heat-shock protein Hsp90 [Dialister sp.]MEE3452702.1 heat-shock protein Hsp90 [Dialister sp.]